MDMEAEDIADTPARKRSWWWVWLIGAVVALAVAAVAYDRGAAPDAAPTTTFANLGDLVGSAPNQDEPAPDFAIPTLEGTTFSLAEHLSEDGRPVFLNLWASWCFPCRAEMPAIDAAAADHPGVRFIGVSVNDQRDAAEDFATDIAVSYTIAFDEGDQVASGYPVLGMPATFLISGDGAVVRTIFGGVDEETIARYLDEEFGL